MPIDPNKVKWDESPAIDPALVKWDAPKTGEPVSRLEKVGMGVADPIHGGAQLLTNLLPDSVVSAGNQLNNWIADKTGLVPKLPEGGVDQQVRQREAEYQAKRAAAGESGFDGWRTVGNIISPVNKAMPFTSAGALGTRIMVGSAGGAASAALAPVGSGDYWDAKGDQVMTGAAFGGAAPVVASGFSRIISPKASTNTAIQKLRKEGITPTPGQVLGGGAKATEEKLTSLPFVGDAIKAGQTRAIEDLNRAVADRSLKPIGEKLPKDLIGRDALDYVESALKSKYNALLPNLTVKGDKQFSDDVAKLSAMIKNGSIDPKYASAFDRYMRSNVLNKFKGQNALTGETFKQIESDIGQQASRLAQSQDPDARLLADAYREVQSNMRNMLARSNPQASNELKAINTGYANFKRMQRASSSVAAEDGVFSPAQLQSAVKALDKSKDKASFARGDALMQDLSDPAKAVLANKIPNSGTADRGFLSLAQLLDPRAATLAVTSPLVYSRAGQAAMANMLAARPQGAQGVANALRKTSPGLGLLSSQVGVELLR